MKSEAMQAYALALIDYLKGNKEAVITVCRDDGFKSELPASVFLRPPEEFSEIEKKALELCRGAILDVGGGGGSISLYLQSKRARIKAIDICPELVGIMRWRGVENVEQADIFKLENTQFDTILLMGNGIGMVETLEGLETFLREMPAHLKPNGQLIFDSLDVRKTDMRQHLKYQKANKKAGRYFGEIRMHFRYGDTESPFFSWLHVDAETLQEYAIKTGWDCKIIFAQDDGEYLAQLVRRG
jgi:2-polyprenyl-3-methyl-5-hydroxy-6-metoxy-1,4-benzoquinol methylase